ncbi:MAG TPA: transglycosylase domain-containing protein [Dictyobacter sp.]|jgi:membrane peptidoglycan carboxypeptidase|nr:transglycosylase domain-containing protein [Dictyobacter sp.]
MPMDNKSYGEQDADNTDSTPIQQQTPKQANSRTYRTHLQQLRHRFYQRHRSRKRLRAEREQTHKSFRRLWVTLFSVTGICLALFLGLAGAGSYAIYSLYNQAQQRYHTQITSLRDLVPQDNLKMYDSKGVLLMQMSNQGIHTYTPLKQISPDLLKLTVSTEDKDFWRNPGIDIPRIIQAAIDDLEHGEAVQGGSTITQQLIKKLIVGNDQNTTHRLNNANIVRKLDEILLTPQINSRYSKADILEMYVNTIYYGEQAYGIDAAATVYFGLQDQAGGKSAASQLDLAQSAMLAGIPNSPYYYDPFVNRSPAYQRFQTIIDMALRNGVITHQQAAQASEEAHKPDFIHRPDPAITENRAPHFSEFVSRQLQQQYKLTPDQLSRSGMKVYTTLDISLQEKIQQIMQEHINDISSIYNISNAAEVLIDFHTGAIRSLLGSIDYNDKDIQGQFDVASQGWRQPGSSFKPYVYAVALQDGYSPAQPIFDGPISIPQPGSQPYAPKNYDQKYHGLLTMRCALQNSLNIPAVKTLQHVGIDKAVKMAHVMGIDKTEGTPGLSMVLGGLDVTLLEHTSAFGTFANSGVHMPYYAIEKVTFSNAQKTYNHPKAHGKRAISPQIAYMMTNMLSDNTSRLPEFYDCNVLQLYSNSQQACYAGNRGAVRPAAAKTGTTNDFRDNWTMGYTSDFVMGVWAGNNDNSAMNNNATGVVGAAPIWHDAMLAAEQGHPMQDFHNPGGLIQKNVTYPDGIQTTDLFLPGHVPTSTGYKSTRHLSSMPIKYLQTPTRKTAAAATHPMCNTFTYAFSPSTGNNANSGW